MSQGTTRMPAIAPAQLSDAQRNAIAAFVSGRGPDVTGPFGPFVPLLRSPELMVRAGALGEYLRYRSALPPRLRELLILLVARHWTQQFEWHVHASEARRVGVTQATIAAIADGRRPEVMADDERLLHDLWDELHRDHTVSDGTYARAVETLGEHGVIDAVGVVGYYTMLAMVMNTARTALPDGIAPPLAPLPR